MTGGRRHIPVSPDVLYAAVDRGQLALADAVALTLLGTYQAEITRKLDEMIGDVIPRCPTGVLPRPKPNPLIRSAHPRRVETPGTSAPSPPPVPPSP
jgi:hypothetical protein